MSENNIVYPEEIVEEFYDRYETLLKIQDGDEEALEKLNEAGGDLKPIKREHHDAIVASVLEDPLAMVSFFIRAHTAMKDKIDALGKPKEEAETIEMVFLSSIFSILSAELAATFKMMLNQYGYQGSPKDLFTKPQNSYKEHLDDDPGEVDEDAFKNLDFTLPNLNKKNDTWN